VFHELHAGNEWVELRIKGDRHEEAGNRAGKREPSREMSVAISSGCKYADSGENGQPDNQAYQWKTKQHFYSVLFISAARSMRKTAMIFLLSPAVLYLSRLVVTVYQAPYSHRLINMNTPTIMVNA
jgi:hypothetical protein